MSVHVIHGVYQINKYCWVSKTFQASQKAEYMKSQTQGTHMDFICYTITPASSHGHFQDQKILCWYQHYFFFSSLAQTGGWVTPFVWGKCWYSHSTSKSKSPEQESNQACVHYNLTDLFLLCHENPNKETVNRNYFPFWKMRRRSGRRNDRSQRDHKS